MQCVISDHYSILQLSQGTGIRLGTVILATVSVVVTLAVCFTGSWELTFVIFIIIPLEIISSRVGLAIYDRFESANNTAIAKISHVVIEATAHIKTVVSLGAEDYLVNSVDKDLSLLVK